MISHVEGGGVASDTESGVPNIGTLYGDLGMVPLYMYPSIVAEDIEHNNDVLGVDSLIFYTITSIPLIK
ncbi:hypothetical protein BT93_H0766 [Corymbia citriodora subsp. variegata]|nr:hypothetical protein BT93_H0766 [Corymbia citriodora subsp. variegata]